MPDLRRDPKGRFLDLGSSLSAWLPQLLSLADCEEFGEPEYMLRVAARWCEREAASRYRLAAHEMEDEDYLAEGRIYATDYHIKKAAHRRAQAAILRETIKRLKEVRP